MARLTRPEKLTDRMWSVYKLVVRGMSQDEIANELGMSVSTVQWHCQKIKTRLGLEGPAMRSIVKHGHQRGFL